MPVQQILIQPAANSLNAAYTPVILRVQATGSSNEPVPPVVYCDVYIDSVFYKTLSKTQYIQLNDDNSEWQFDIQDALQEVLMKHLAANGASAIVKATNLIATVNCKFRSSGLDNDGFIVSEYTTPVQATGGNPAVAGDGYASSTFFALNTALQQDDNPNLATHLNSFKQGLWQSNAYPLTHRPKRYFIGRDDSDYFPFVYTGNNIVSCIKLTLKKKDGTVQSFTSCEALPACTISVRNISISRDAPSGTGYYNASFILSGGAPDHYKVEYRLTSSGTWTDITSGISVVGSIINYTIGANGTHQLRITPYCDSTRAGIPGQGSYTLPVCKTVTGLTIIYTSISQQLSYSFTDANNLPQTLQLFKDGVAYGSPRTNAASNGTFTITQSGDYYIQVTTPCSVGTPITETSNTITAAISNPICSAPYNVTTGFTPDGRYLRTEWAEDDTTYNDLVRVYDADNNNLLAQAVILGGTYFNNIDTTAYPAVQRFYSTVQHLCPSPSIIVISPTVERNNNFELSLDVSSGDSVYVVCKHYGQEALTPFEAIVTIELRYTIGSSGIITTNASNTMPFGVTRTWIAGAVGMGVVSANIISVNPISHGTYTYTY